RDGALPRLHAGSDGPSSVRRALVRIQGPALLGPGPAGLSRPGLVRRLGGRPTRGARTLQATLGGVTNRCTAAINSDGLNGLASTGTSWCGGESAAPP